MIELIKKQLLSLPLLSTWPEMKGFVDEMGDGTIPSLLEIPGLSARAVGGKAERALCGSAAIFCIYTSIRLVDDMLDDDPSGRFHSLGAPRAANLALAFQAAAFCMIGRQESLSVESRAALQAYLGEMGLATARGQELDVVDNRGVGEEQYWKATRAKTPPLYGAALYLGAILGGASLRVAQEVASLGLPVGLLVQIHDDLTDAMEVPARPDWKHRSNNLAILYAMLAEHSEQQYFLSLLPDVDDPEVLTRAQDLLVRCGAVSFCFYHLIDQYREAKQRLRSTPLPDPTPLEELLNLYIEPLQTLFETKGVVVPEEIFIESG